MATIMNENDKKKFEGIFTMEQCIKEDPPTEEQLEKEKKRAEFEKQWYAKHPNVKRF